LNLQLSAGLSSSSPDPTHHCLALLVGSLCAPAATKIILSKFKIQTFKICSYPAYMATADIENKKKMKRTSDDEGQLLAITEMEMMDAI
jgi:hypothetical protein